MPDKNPSNQIPSVQTAVWGEKGPNYNAPYDDVVTALAHSVAEYYRVTMWDLYTIFRHPWYFAHQEGLQGWSKLEAEQWIPFQPHYTLYQYNQRVLTGRLRRNAGHALSDPALMAWWTDCALSKGGQEFSAKIAKEMGLQKPEINYTHRAFALLWDRHCPPLRYWAYPPMAAMFEYILSEKGLNVSITEGMLKMICTRLRLRQSDHIVVKWAHSEGLGILDFDVVSAHIISLPTISESGWEE